MPQVRATRAVTEALGFAGRCRYELVVEDGRVVELWPHAEPGKLTRSDLEKLR